MSLAIVWNTLTTANSFVNQANTSYLSGEGATLREVLKHNTVEEVSMIEIDEKMVTVSRESIPEWSDCSDLTGSASWCVDDPRTLMYYEDAHEWFMERYSGDEGKKADLDVIILDAL